MEGVGVPPGPADERVFLPKKFHHEQISDVHVCGQQERHRCVRVQSRPVDLNNIIFVI